MSVLIAKASGNLTASSSWGLVDSTSYLNSETGNETLTTAYSGTRSSAFTPGAIEIDGIAVKLNNRIGTTGTISVNLELDSDNSQVSGTEVTINVADLPAAAGSLEGGWIFFKFAAPVTLLAATAYQVAAKTSSSTQVSLYRDATGDNIARALRTTTEQAPTTGDDMIITGEKTGAGAETAITVTMNETATTDYGSNTNSVVTPALAICDGGTLSYGTTAATNYYLKLSGNAIVYCGGVLNIGTTGTPIPRDSTAVLEFDPAADGDHGLLVRNLGTFNSQGLSRTSGKNVVSCKLNTDEAANSTSLGVDTDTGWLDNDEIAVASTTRTPTQGEKGTLNGNAGASSLTVDGFAGAGGGLLNAHGGTAPVQAEVVLLTRNVKIRSATSTIMAYIGITLTAIVDIDWTEFYYIGENATLKKGIEVQTTTGSFNMQYSSIHDTEDGGFYVTQSAAAGIVFSNNVTFNTNTAAVSGVSSIGFNSDYTGTDITVDNNVFVLTNSNSGTNAANCGVQLADSGLTYTNNTIAGHNGATSQGSLHLTETTSRLGTFSGNTIHSGNGFGLFFYNTNSSIDGVISGLSIWRNASSGIRGTFGGTYLHLPVFESATLFGNSINFEVNSAGGYTVIFKNSTFNSDASFTTSSGISPSSSPGNVKVYLLSCSFGATSGHTSFDIQVAGTGWEYYLVNTTLASTTEYGTPGNGSFVKSGKHDGSATTHKATYNQGTINADQTIRHTASGFSWKMTPSSATRKLILPGPTVMDNWKLAVKSGTTVTITAYVYKDSSYNGTAPRLVVIGGIVGGVSSDVTDSLTVAHSNWEQLSVQVTVTEDGVLEYFVECDGTAGNVYVDDIDWS